MRVRVGIFVALVAPAMGLVPVGSAFAAPRKTPATETILDAGLQLSDLPGGPWIDKPNSSAEGPNLDSQLNALASCRSLKNAQRQRLANRQSDAFIENGADDSERISTSISVYKTAAQIQTRLHSFRAPTALTCIKHVAAIEARAFGKSSKAHVRGSARRLSVEPAGDGSVGFEISFTATEGGPVVEASMKSGADSRVPGTTASGSTFTIYLDIVLVGVGRAGLTFLTETLTPSASAANDARVTLVPVVVDRMRAAGA